MLNSPTADQGGFSNLFTVTDLKHFAHREAKLMDKIKDANEAIELVDTFLQAYGKFSPQETSKLVSLLEVRCVMHAWGKKAEGRASYSSQKDVMASIIKDAQSLYSQLPDMPLLAGRASEKEADAASSKRKNDSSIRQVALGKVTDDVLISRGFKVGEIIKESVGEKRMFKITKLNADQKTISVVQLDEDTEDKEDGTNDKKSKKKQAKEETEEIETELKRTDLVGFTVVVQSKPVSFTDIFSPTDNINIIKAIVEGGVKQALLKEMLSSSEANCSIVMNSNKLQAHASKKFQPNKLTLIPLTTMVSISNTPLKTPWLEVGKIDCNEKSHTIYIKSGNTTLKAGAVDASRKTDFVVKFWIIDATSTGDTRRANCEFSECSTEITVGKTKVSLTFPTITNTKVIEDQEIITVLSRDEPSDSVKGQASKRLRRK
jgi:hypothetical protein